MFENKEPCGSATHYPGSRTTTGDSYYDYEPAVYPKVVGDFPRTVRPYFHPYNDPRTFNIDEILKAWEEIMNHKPKVKDEPVIEQPRHSILQSNDKNNILLRIDVSSFHDDDLKISVDPQNVLRVFVDGRSETETLDDSHTVIFDNLNIRSTMNFEYQIPEGFVFVKSYGVYSGILELSIRKEKERETVFYKVS